MHARGPCLLRQARDELLDILAGGHHHIGELVHHHDDQRQLFELRRLRVRLGGREQRISQLLAPVGGLFELAVVAGDIAHAQGRHQLIAPLHLGDAPAKCAGSLAHVRDHRRQQVWNALVHGQLQHLRIDHDEAHVTGLRLVEKAQHHGVDSDRLTRAGSPRH